MDIKRRIKFLEERLSELGCGEFEREIEETSELFEKCRKKGNKIKVIFSIVFLIGIAFFCGFSYFSIYFGCVLVLPMLFSSFIALMKVHSLGTESQLRYSLFLESVVCYRLSKSGLSLEDCLKQKEFVENGRNF